PVRLLSTFAFLTLLALTSFAICQEHASLSLKHEDWPELARYVKFDVTETDSGSPALIKKCANATNNELRNRYNYWLQGTGSTDELIRCVQRYQLLRSGIESEPSIAKLKEQELEFATVLEKQAKLLKAKKRDTTFSIGVASAEAYRLNVMLELAQLKE